MTVVAAVLAVALLVTAGLLLLSGRARRRADGVARRTTADRNEQVRRAEVERGEAMTMALNAERRAEEAAQRAEEAEARADNQLSPEEAATRAGDRLEALWGLTRLASGWERRRAEDQSTAPPGAAPNDLAGVLDVEIGRIREEAGIPGSLQVSVEPPADPADAIVVSCAVQLLLAAVVRYCDGFDLFVHRWGQQINAVIVCDGFDGPDSVADDTSAILAALAPTGGDVDVDRDAEGRLRARLSVPVTASR